jgi:hypothetical protein
MLATDAACRRNAISTMLKEFSEPMEGVRLFWYFGLALAVAEF